VTAGSRLVENLIEQRTAAGAKQSGLDEGIFFLKAVHDLLALIQGHGGVENHFAFFFRSFDQARIGARLCPGKRDGKNQRQHCGDDKDDGGAALQFHDSPSRLKRRLGSID
jgi:hypothetical protein